MGKHEKVIIGHCLECGKNLCADKYELMDVVIIENPDKCFHNHKE